MGLRKGWGQPDKAYVHHYFVAGRSLCEKWQFGGDLAPEPYWFGTSKCKVCERKAAKR